MITSMQTSLQTPREASTKGLNTQPACFDFRLVSQFCQCFSPNAALNASCGYADGTTVPSSAQGDYMRIRVSFHGAGFARERVNVLHMTDSANMLCKRA